MEIEMIRSVRFSNVTRAEAVDYLMDRIEKRDGPAVVITPNAEIVQMCIEDESLKTLVNQADLVVPDGIGVIYAAKILGKPLKEKVAGYDLARAMLPKLAEAGKSLYLLGAAPGVAETAAEKMKADVPGLIICGTADGYFKEEEPVIEEINRAKPDLLFVCLGAPKQERFMMKWKDKLDVGAMMGLGGSLDVFAGKVQRAPDIFIKLGLEWFYRLMKEPKRFFRMLKLPQFLFGTIFYKLRGGK